MCVAFACITKSRLVQCTGGMDKRKRAIGYSISKICTICRIKFWKHNCEVINHVYDMLQVKQCYLHPYKRQWTRSEFIQVMACRLFVAKPLLDCQLEFSNILEWLTNQNTTNFFYETTVRPEENSKTQILIPHSKLIKHNIKCRSTMINVEYTLDYKFIILMG